MKEFVLHADGRCELADAGKVLWSSDDDDDFQEQFGETIDPEDIDDVIEFLMDAGKIDDDEEIDIVDHTPDDDGDDDPDENDDDGEDLH